MLNKTYTINGTKAISETIGGETIIINLETGYYYSVNQTASVIWNELQKNNSIKNISEHFLNCFEVDPETAEKCVTEIVNLFLKDDLLVETDSAIACDAGGQCAKAVKEKFIIPAIERYDDMARALIADPVHDVNEEGWPNIKP